MDGVGNGEATTALALSSATKFLNGGYANAGNGVVIVSLAANAGQWANLLHKQGVSYDVIASRVAVVHPTVAARVSPTEEKRGEGINKTISTPLLPSPALSSPPLPSAFACGLLPSLSSPLPSAELLGEVRRALQHVSAALEARTGPAGARPIDATLSHREVSGAAHHPAQPPAIPKLALGKQANKRVLLVVDDASLLHATSVNAAAGLRLLRALASYGTHARLTEAGLMQFPDSAIGIAPLSARRTELSTAPPISGGMTERTSVAQATGRSSPATITGRLKPSPSVSSISSSRRTSLSQSASASSMQIQKQSPAASPAAAPTKASPAAITGAPSTKSSPAASMGSTGTGRTSIPSSPSLPPIASAAAGTRALEPPALPPISSHHAAEAAALRTADVSVMMLMLTESDYKMRGTLFTPSHAAPGTIAIGTPATSRPRVPPSSEDFAPVSLVRYLQTLCDVCVRLYPLPSGYSKDVQGRCIVQRRAQPVVGYLHPPHTDDARSLSTRRDGSAVLLPSVALSSGTAEELAWVKGRPRFSLFRITAEYGMRGVGDVGYLRTQ